MALSNIQEIIERSVFEAIRLVLVKYEYLPDITLFPDTAQGKLDYQEALATVISEKGFLIELLNENSNYKHGSKAVPRIVVNSGAFLEGELGGDPAKFFEELENNTFEAKVTPPQTSSFFIDIHLVSNTVQQERVINSILSEAIPKRKYLPYYNDTESKFFIRHINYYQLDDSTNGILEKVNAYEVPDCWESEYETVQVGIAKINEIKLITEINKYTDPPVPESTDTLTVTPGD